MSGDGEELLLLLDTVLLLLLASELVVFAVPCGAVATGTENGDSNGVTGELAFGVLAVVFMFPVDVRVARTGDPDVRYKGGGGMAIV